MAQESVASITLKTKNPQTDSQERLDNIWINFSIETVKILLEVLVTVLEHQRQFLVRVKDVVEPHYVLVFQFLQQADLPQGRGRYSLGWW